MRSIKRLAAVLAVSVAASTVLASMAEAQQRRRAPLTVTVQKRSYLDPGNVVPVGSLSRYANQHLIASPAYSNTGELYGEGTLPPRIGSGANPFANTIAFPNN